MAASSGHIVGMIPDLVRLRSPAPSFTALGLFVAFYLGGCTADDTSNDTEPLASTGPGSASSESSSPSPSPLAPTPGSGGTPASAEPEAPAEPEPEGAGGSGPNTPPNPTTPIDEPEPVGNAGTSSIGGAGNAGAANEPEPTVEPIDGGGEVPMEPSADAAVPEEAGTVAPTGGCAARDFVLCEDFEDTAVGEIPDGWERRGEEVWVDEDEAWRGERSLKLGAIPSWERRIAREASGLGSAHWGRIYYKVELPVPDAFVHSTMVALTGEGPMYGRSEFRLIDTVKQAVDTPDVGSRHNFLFNVEPDDFGEFGRETSYDWEFDGQWHCAEYHVDASNQSYAFYLDGNEELSFEDGAGNYEDTDIPDVFEEIRVGWNNYQEAEPGFTVWMDDIAFDLERIGCE